MLQADQQFPTRVFVPPFILAPENALIREDPHTLNDFSRVMGTGEFNILFCSYCLSHDQSWVLVTCTDRRGEISDTTMIKIHPQNRLVILKYFAFVIFPAIYSSATYLWIRFQINTLLHLRMTYCYVLQCAVEFANGAPRPRTILMRMIAHDKFLKRCCQKGFTCRVNTSENFDQRKSNIICVKFSNSWSVGRSYDLSYKHLSTDPLTAKGVCWFCDVIVTL